MWSRAESSFPDPSPEWSLGSHGLILKRWDFKFIYLLFLFLNGLKTFYRLNSFLLPSILTSELRKRNSVKPTQNCFVMEYALV